MLDPDDFGAAIARAQRVSKDMGGLFPQEDGRVAFEPGRGRAGPDHEFEAHVDVFVLPADKDAYEDVMNMILRGEAVVRYEEKTFTKEGEFMVAFCYLTPITRERPVNNQDAGDAEAVVRPRRIP